MKLKELSAKVNDFAKSAFFKDIYPFVIALFVFLCWTFDIEEFGIVTIVFFAMLVLIFVDDVFCLLPIVFMVAMIIPKAVDPASYGIGVFLHLIMIPIGIIVHVIRFKKKLVFGGLFSAQAAISVALLLGGLFTITAERYAQGLAYALLLGVALLLMYFLFYMYGNPPENIDLKRYVCMCLTALGMLLVAEYVVFFARLYRVEGIQCLYHDTATDLGWGISNNVASLLHLTIPAGFYLAVKSKRFSWAYMIVVVLQYAAIVLGYSRGGILFGAIMAPVLIAYTLYKVVKEGDKARTKRFLIEFGVVCAIVIFAFILILDNVLGVVKGVIGQGTKDTGRIPLFLEAFGAFKQNPVFGGGIYYDGELYNNDYLPMYWFHSTFSQVMGSLGLVGIFTYAYYYWKRIYIVLKNDLFNRFMLLGFITFEMYAMLDTATFVPIPTMLIVVLLTMMLEFTNRSLSEDATPAHMLRADCFFKNVYGRTVGKLIKGKPNT